MKTTKSISKLFNKITSSNTTSEYYSLNCFNSFRTENKLKEDELAWENHEYCEIVMPDDKKKIK